MLPVSFTLIDYGAEKMPQRMHPEDAGMDVYAPCDIIVKSGEIANIPLGFGMTMPTGYMAYVTARGSMAKNGIFIAENPIDSNYRGEVHATIVTIGPSIAYIRKGERFAQVVVVPCVCSTSSHLHSIPPAWPIIKSEEAPESDRGTGHHGSTNELRTLEPCDPLDRAGEVITLKVIGKPKRLSYPVLNGPGHMDIVCSFDPEQHTVTIKNCADIVTLGIAVEILQQQYRTALEELSVDMQIQIYKVIKEVCTVGQNRDQNLES